MTLSPAQQEAVARTGQDICVVAGPGSGKTRVLVERFAELVKQGISPARILTITFTEKAANEIKQRLARRFNDRTELRREIAQAPVSTIHGFCLGVLKSHALAANLDPEFRLLDEAEALAEQAGALDDTLDRMAIERRDEFRALAESWNAFNLREPVLGVYEAARAAGGLAQLGLVVPTDAANALTRVRETVRDALAACPRPTKQKAQERAAQVREWLESESRQESTLAWLDAFSCTKVGLKAGHPLYDMRDLVQDELIPAARQAWAADRFAAQRAMLRDIVVAFHAEYRARKRRTAALDFGDLEEMTLGLFDSDNRLRREIANRFEAILMDELQDTNPVQWQLLDRLRQPDRFFAVGDVNQSIYGFRHAAPGLFLEYQNQLQAKGCVIDRLETNYRSRPEILEFARTLTEGQAGIVPHQLIPGLTLPPPGESPIEVLRVETPDAEALWVAHRIREMAATQRRLYSDFAVLARNSAVFEPLEAALQQYDVPYVLKRGRNFFDEPEIVDLTNWLRLFADPEDRLAWVGILRSPFFSRADQDLFRDQLEGDFVPVEARSELQRWRALLADLPIDALLLRILDESGYEKTLQPRAQANIDKLLHLLRRQEQQEPGAVTSWLRRLRDLRVLGREPNAPLVESADAVQVMTIHIAKGLEFPVVFLASMQKGTSFRRSPLAWSLETGLGASWRDPVTGETVSDTAHAVASRKVEQGEAEEADRLLYVALTRAAEHLVLSYEQVERSRARWPQLVERQFSLAWPQPNGASAQGAVRLVRRQGVPPALDRNVDRVQNPASGVRVLLAPRPYQLQPPVLLPVTAAVDLEICPRRYFLRQVIRWPVPTAENDASYAETSGQPPRSTETGRIVHEILAGRGVEGPTDEQTRLAQAFTDSPLGRRAQHAGAEREAGLLFTVDGTLMEGIVDLWFEDAAGAVLVDYKTDYALRAESRTAYERQLQFYALALSRELGRVPDEALLFLLRRREVKRVPLDPQSMERPVELVREIVAAHRSGEFPIVEEMHCRYCPYAGNGCPVQKIEEVPPETPAPYML